MAIIVDSAKYSHSPAHEAVASRDHAALLRILQSLSPLRDPSEVLTEADAVAEEHKADAISAVIDHRDVPHRETPLHLAVRLGDAAAAEMLMAAGANWSLQNQNGWNALQEAICCREEAVAVAIYRHSKPLAWTKWRRRLPRLIGVMRKMRDFYLEMTFHFESSVVPFVSRVAPSDTYRIWKRGSNLRADMTLAGFDGFKIQRSDQSVLFLGEGSEDGSVAPGSLCMVFHRDKEVVNAWDGGGSQVKEAEARRQVAAMLRTKVTRPGIDVTRAVLLPRLTWRRHERTEMVGQWKAKVYDVHNVVLSVRSRQVPGEKTEAESEANVYKELLTEDERRQLDLVLNNVGGDQTDITTKEMHSCSDGEVKREKKGWFGSRKQRSVKLHGKKKMPRMWSSPCLNESVSNFEDSNSSFQVEQDRHSVEIDVRGDDELQRGRDAEKYSAVSSDSEIRQKDSNNESEYKKGLRPILWLSHDFPLQVEEFIPLLDILANKVKAIRRLRELLTTKLRPGTFPVKVAIPVVPTVQVLVTFTKFEELQQLDEFCTPPSSPPPEDSYNASTTQSSISSSSWRQWIKTPYHRHSSSAASYPIDAVEDKGGDPFTLPPDYTWTTFEARRKKKPKYGKPRRARAQESLSL